MNDSNKSAWFSIELALVFIFSFDVVVTFFFNLLEYGSSTNIMWLRLDVTGVLGLTGFEVSILALMSTLVLIPFSIVSVALLFSRIVKPSWFKAKFRVKYWYGVFISQILTWILISNL
jgi:hypothetical protein